jgi:magnesium-transporting ATPase (P-type)
MAFVTLAMAELVLVFSIRTGTSPAWQGPRNPLLVSSVLVSFLLLVLPIYFAPLRDAFGTHVLGSSAAAIVAGLAIAPAALTEAAKVVLCAHRRRSRASETTVA